MSDLVERVSKAIARQRWTEEAADPNLIDAEVEYGWDTYTDEARAAIKAVAEWIERQEEGDLDFITFKLRRAANEQ
ncbi:MAG: hypothetical protein E6Q97_32520 [Desulfurellales bacterium]|nr:MAG: hypothetical protein E6Q97_32520 [Desulfurellales bacterium]